MDTQIYIAAHRAFTLPQTDPVYIPLQVGRAQAEDLGYLADNTGCHISEKNSSYCELTGMYWIWKNSNARIVGLCHYRRYLARGAKILTGSEIEDLMRWYDLILPDSARSANPNVYAHYCEKHRKQDLECCLQVMKEQCPAYVPAFLWSLSCNLISMGNIMIARRQVFDRYCAWLFDILFEVEKRTDLTGCDAYQGRVFGFLSERLLRAWVLMQKLQVREEAVLCEERFL